MTAPGKRLLGRARVAEWPVTDPMLPELVLIQGNTTTKSYAWMRPGVSGRRRPFRQDPAGGAAQVRRQKAEGRRQKAEGRIIGLTAFRREISSVLDFDVSQ